MWWTCGSWWPPRLLWYRQDMQRWKAIAWGVANSTCWSTLGCCFACKLWLPVMRSRGLCGGLKMQASDVQIRSALHEHAVCSCWETVRTIWGGPHSPLRRSVCVFLAGARAPCDPVVRQHALCWYFSSTFRSHGLRCTKAPRATTGTGVGDVVDGTLCTGFAACLHLDCSSHASTSHWT